MDVLLGRKAWTAPTGSSCGTFCPGRIRCLGPTGRPGCPHPYRAYPVACTCTLSNSTCLSRGSERHRRWCSWLDLLQFKWHRVHVQRSCASNKYQSSCWQWQWCSWRTRARSWCGSGIWRSCYRWQPCRWDTGLWRSPPRRTPFRRRTFRLLWDTPCFSITTFGWPADLRFGKCLWINWLNELSTQPRFIKLIHSLGTDR